MFGSPHSTDAEWNFAQGSLINVKVIEREREKDRERLMRPMAEGGWDTCLVLCIAAVTALVECYSHMKELSETRHFCLLKSCTVPLSAHSRTDKHTERHTHILEYNYLSTHLKKVPLTN